MEIEDFGIHPLLLAQMNLDSKSKIAFHDDESRGVARAAAAVGKPTSSVLLEAVHPKDGDSDGRAGADREASCTGLRSQEALLQ